MMCVLNILQRMSITEASNIEDTVKDAVCSELLRIMMRGVNFKG